MSDRPQTTPSKADFVIYQSRRLDEPDVFELVEMIGARLGRSAMLLHQASSYEGALGELKTRFPEVRPAGESDRKWFFNLPPDPGPSPALLREEATALRNAAAQQEAKAEALDAEAASLEAQHD